MPRNQRGRSERSARSTAVEVDAVPRVASRAGAARRGNWPERWRELSYGRHARTVAGVERTPFDLEPLPQEMVSERRCRRRELVETPDHRPASTQWEAVDLEHPYWRVAMPPEHV